MRELRENACPKRPRTVTVLSSNQELSGQRAAPRAMVTPWDAQPPLAWLLELEDGVWSRVCHLPELRTALTLQLLCAAGLVHSQRSQNVLPGFQAASGAGSTRLPTVLSVRVAVPLHPGSLLGPALPDRPVNGSSPYPVSTQGPLLSGEAGPFPCQSTGPAARRRGRSLSLSVHRARCSAERQVPFPVSPQGPLLSGEAGKWEHGRAGCRCGRAVERLPGMLGYRPRLQASPTVTSEPPTTPAGPPHATKLPPCPSEVLLLGPSQPFLSSWNRGQLLTATLRLALSARCHATADTVLSLTSWTL
ncbi:hypothetical protein P7K49_026131 [Saguinus oedipus]|uniref:Uncharacterized protein n=1 Tax=Saguinus oedipus TaxID=9490 RepID=A0ABQ9UJ35_SAGOE|nr:hypothetical protein P7K49_026131 [Saguinus oedipus]